MVHWMSILRIRVFVSVIIPAFRSAGHIKQALCSVFAQTFRDYEVLVVNDGSPDTDLLEQVLSPYEKRIRYFKQTNGGPSVARNTGIRQAKGEYVAFLDSDDRWFPDHLAKHVSILHEDHLLGLVYSDAVLVRDDRPIAYAFALQPQQPPVSFESILTERCAMITSSVVASRAALIDVGLFDERFLRCEDFDLWLRMAFHGIRMNFCGEPTLYHGISDDGLSSNAYLMKRALIEVYQKAKSTLALSVYQQVLIKQLIRRTEAASHLDLLKERLLSGEYVLALQSGECAKSLTRNPKLSLVLIGLRFAPRMTRHCYNAYERWLCFRNRLRDARSTLRLKRAQPPEPSLSNFEHANRFAETDPEGQLKGQLKGC